MCLIYKAYLQKRKNGMSKNDACYFDASEDICTDCPDINQIDIDDALPELHSNGLIKCFVDGGFALNNEAIILMENRFKKGISEVISFIKDLPFIP